MHLCICVDVCVWFQKCRVRWDWCSVIHVVITTGGKLIAGGQTSATRPEPQREVRPFPADQQALAADFLSGMKVKSVSPKLNEIKIFF